ncbi:MAG: pilus assembly protein PilM [Desulfobacteraceae bacterium]|nr:PilN domain-containing protein [Desulfobacteraceae bacterium]MBC2754923.1 pilus assembly protein PilM [Desulfobacteraceae bacterium]
MLFNSSIGIEINDLQINIVYLKGSFKGVNLAAESSCQLDAGKFRRDRQSDIVSFINGFIREEKITAADIFIGISGDHSMIREIEFPLAVRENLRTTLAYEIEKYIPMSANDIYFDYHIISESKDEEKLKLLLVAVKKDVFEYYLEVAEHIDKGVSGIEIVPAALANYFLYHQETQQEPVILLYSRAFGYDAVVLKQRSMVYTKSITVAETPDDKSAFDSEELIRLRDIFCPEVENVRVVLYGIPESDDRFRRISTEFQDITSGITHAATHSEQFIPAFGIALNGICNVPVEMNLMPAQLRKKPNKTGIYVMFALAGLLVLAGVVWAGSHLVIQRQMLKNFDTELARLRTEASAVEQIQAETEQVKKNIEYIRSLRPGGAYVIEVAEELSNIIPPDAWLTELKLVGNEISLYGMAESASGLILLLEESPLFEDVEFISAIRKGRNGKEIFRIGCKVFARK